MNNKVTVAGVVLALALSLYGAFGVHNTVTVEKAGSVTGPDVYIPMSFHSDVTVGGNWYATTTTSGTYLGTTIANNKFITETGATAVTRTLPTKASLDAAGFLPNTGDVATKYIFASTSAVTLAGNTGVLLFSASTTKVIAASSTGRVDFIRLNAENGKAIQAILVAD